MGLPDSESSPPGFARSLAIVIGIDDYAHGIPPLLNAVRDAHTVAETLRLQGFEILRLLDAEASLASLTHLFSHQLPSLQPPPDRLLIYFAGHGLAHTAPQLHLAGFLLPSDARRDEPSSYWPMAALHEALRQLTCGHLLLILDCCFAGAFPHFLARDIRAPSTPAPLFLERFRHFTSRRSFQLLLSTAHDELASDRLLAKPSQESLGDGLHSPFALAFLEAIRSSSPADTNRDGLLTATELYTFLRDRLLQRLPPHASQTPALWHLDWHDGGEFLFLLADTFPALPPAAPLSQHANPYLGLRPFSSAHRHLFFGRERLVDTLLTRLRSQALLLLCGPSGAGKSSIVHAGLLPRLGENGSWNIPPSLRPSAQPLQALSSWLAALAPGTTIPSADDLASQPHRAADILRDWLSHDALRNVVLVVDPLEELVTACLDDSARLAFLRALSCLLQLSHPRLHLLLLLRSDFEPHFLSRLLPADLSPERWHDGRFQLPLMNRDELRRCIEKPAETCVLFFDAGLVERLLDDVEQMPGALPLLSVALSELFDAYLASGRDDRTLSFEDYRQMGGIAGALQRRAELIFHGSAPFTAEADTPPPMSPWELPAFQCMLHNVLLRMVSPEGGELARRRVPRTELDYLLPEENALVQRVLHTLETCRLVVASDEEGPCVEPAHDALLSSWPRLHDWARHAQRELLLLRRISHAAAEWHRHHQSHDFLWADGRLDQLGLAPDLPHGAGRILPLALPIVPPDSSSTEFLIFNAVESEFLRASARHRRSLRILRSSLILAVPTLLVALTVAALFQANKATNNAWEAQRQQWIAEDNARESLRQKNLALLSAQISHARSLLPTDPTKAMLVLLATNTRKEFPDSEWLQTALDTSQHVISSAILTGHSDTITSARFSPDGTHVLTTSYDGMARLWHADGRENPLIVSTPGARVNSAAFSLDGSHILIASENCTTHIWRADGTGTPVEFANHRESVNSAVFSADGSYILTASDDGTARLQSVDGKGRPLAFKTHKKSNVRSAIFSPNETHVLTTSDDGIARLWRADGTRTPLVFSVRNDKVNSAIFSPDKAAVLTIFESGNMILWDINGTREPVVFTNPTDIDTVKTAVFSPDGSKILTTTGKNTAYLWQADKPKSSEAIADHEGKVNTAVFSPDGAYVLTASDDGTARLWRTDGTGTPITFLGHTRPVKIVAFSPDGTQILTASDDLTVRIWRIHGVPPPPFFDVKTQNKPAVTSSPDGSLIAIATNNTAQIWRIEDKKRLAILSGHTDLVNTAVFSPDGAQILTASNDGTARLWRADGMGTPLVFQRSRQALTSAIFSPDGTHVLTVSSSAAHIWRANGEATSIVFPIPDSAHPRALFSPDGTHVAIVSDDNAVRLWSASGTGSPVVFSGHQGQVNSAVFSPDGSQILIASADRTARLWRVHEPDKSITLSEHMDGVNSAVFSNDGAYILTASDDGTARLWRADIGTMLRHYHPGHHSKVYSAAFTSDDTRFITSSDDGTARLWPLDERTTHLIFHNESTLSAHLVRNGTRLVTFSNNMFRVWPFDPDTLADELQKMTTACLTTSEREKNLLETPTQAKEEYERCERSHGRLPWGSIRLPASGLSVPARYPCSDGLVGKEGSRTHGGVAPGELPRGVDANNPSRAQVEQG